MSQRHRAAHASEDINASNTDVCVCVFVRIFAGSLGQVPVSSFVHPCSGCKSKACGFQPSHLITAAP